jgi:hypothetical protein
MSRLKIESARRQLGTALALYLDNRDPVSVHCLAGGGCELIEFYAKKAGFKPFTSHILETRPAAQPALDIPKLKRIQRQYWTAFKHATHQHSGKERDDDELLTRFSDEQNDAPLFIGWYDYGGTTNTMPVEAQVHQIWYIALHPDKLDPKHPKEPYEEFFPDLPTKSRAEQKQILNNAIERARVDKDVMSDSRTDTRALMLGWEHGRK